jgi:hypothetical protein
MGQEPSQASENQQDDNAGEELFDAHEFPYFVCALTWMSPLTPAG